MPLQSHVMVPLSLRLTSREGGGARRPLPHLARGRTWAGSGPGGAVGVEDGRHVGIGG